MNRIRRFEARLDCGPFLRRSRCRRQRSQIVPYALRRGRVIQFSRRNKFLRCVAFRRVSFEDNPGRLFLVSEGDAAAGYRAKKFISSQSGENGMALRRGRFGRTFCRRNIGQHNKRNNRALRLLPHIAGRFLLDTNPDILHRRPADAKSNAIPASSNRMFAFAGRLCPDGDLQYPENGEGSNLG